MIASVFALTGDPKPTTYPASYLYAHSSDLNDVTSGSDGACSPAYLCTAGPGYDGPTGWGTPNGIAAFGAPAGDVITVDNPGAQAGTADVAFSLQMKATDSAAGQTLTFAAAGLPPGLSIDPSSGLISGTPTTVGSFNVTVTATDTTGASGTAIFPFTVASPVSFSGPGPQAGYLGQPVLVAAHAIDAVPGRTLRYSAQGLPGGLSINPTTGTITGLPTAGGYYHPTLTATDNTGRFATQPLVWYLASAQASGRAGAVRLDGGKNCLTGQNGSPVQITRCAGSMAQTWMAHPDGTLRALGKCLTVAGSGTQVQIGPCSQSPAQQWRIAPRGELVNPATSKCLTASGLASGTRPGVHPCIGTVGQRWAGPPGPLVSAVTGTCADTGAGTSGHVQAWYCGNTPAQAWSAEPDGTIRAGGKCLTATSGGTTSQTQVDLVTCKNAGNQQWLPGAHGTLVNLATGLCLTDPGNSPVPGTRLVAARCTTASGQVWRIE